MPRAPRMHHPDLIAHVTNRGAAGQDIFLSDDDRRYFLGLVEAEVVKRGWGCHAFCLMDNHYHLLVQSPAGDLSQGMHAIGSDYANTFNRVHERSGHVFQGRFRAVLVDREEHALELARYIALNPVRAGLVSLPQDWRWSSYAALINHGWTRPGLRSSWFVSQFGSAAALQAFVEAGLDDRETGARPQGAWPRSLRADSAGGAWPRFVGPGPGLYGTSQSGRGLAPVVAGGAWPRSTVRG